MTKSYLTKPADLILILPPVLQLDEPALRIKIVWVYTNNHTACRSHFLQIHAFLMLHRTICIRGSYLQGRVVGKGQEGKNSRLYCQLPQSADLGFKTLYKKLLDPHRPEHELSQFRTFANRPILTVSLSPVPSDKR